MKKVREKLNAKLRKSGGFTLVEMLIVVAIIAILIAVSIPLISSSLEKSRHAVDQANVRDAIALATIEYLTDTKSFSPDGKTYTYQVTPNHQGILDGTNDNVTDAENVETQCTCGSASTDTLKVFVDKDGNVDVNWTIDSEGIPTKNNSFKGSTT